MRAASPLAIAGAAFAAGAGVLALLGFGPLDPPNGPIAPTYETLADVEPRTAINTDNTPGDADSVYRISAPGSYYLTGPFNISAGKSGIEIAGTNITVDLNGFRMAGLKDSLDGVHVSGAPFGITIRNGVVYTLGGDGIDALDSPAMRIVDVTVINCAGQGIVVGDASEVAHCNVQNSGTNGINTRASCVVAGCIAHNSGGIGINVDNDSIVRDCIATANAGDGITTNDGCTIADCIASGNTGNGINTAGTCIVSGSVGRINGGIGIDVDSIAVIKDRAARDNTGDGITGNNGCVITSSSAGVNETGIAASIAASIYGCDTFANRSDGIEFESYSDIRVNDASGNAAGAGLRALGQFSIADLNQCSDNAVGIGLNGSANMIHRNGVANDLHYTGFADDYIDWAGIDAWVNSN